MVFLSLGRSNAFCRLDFAEHNDCAEFLVHVEAYIRQMCMGLIGFPGFNIIELLLKQGLSLRRVADACH